ncbi:glutamine-hydrolyzing carbamoyl-phosphate synthase small subunit [Desulfohalobiaceae bacterium Ax17]|uniref:glutamine-hydrolyzing carbamoyl-phosphate synthase small subunit n=1 Tax=Desulfovulcanus ferrireducens TaxID=2831190 RepID=UPI00207BA7D1|nr:glutamine-hydrolyzing carbamoyl-phosphate synthase small subunit [Desulfovulcanus ferrireducens]MBT8762525.1 glutamine-hydrolyzing carbamoyl-phosphate synthase small subunit [Desulfovulcanus ferrireducens]
MQAILALEDGTWFEGKSFTGHGKAQGEVIFNTGMTGYQEVLTDPSYLGQMVCMTYPLIGNYGVNLEDVESDRVQVAAFIVKECCHIPSNWRAQESLPAYLKRHNVMGIEGIDTRALTRHLRIFGAMRGIISTEELDPKKLAEHAKELPSMEGANLAYEATCKHPYIWTDSGPQKVSLENSRYAWPGSGPKVVVFDFGIKWNILRLLKEEGLDLLVVPAHFTYEQVHKLSPDAIFLSNGPGDPAALEDTIHTISLLSEHYPMAGICLGHQLLGLALGGKSFKLKFGHHGLNHPVQELSTKHIEISSQNHGFCIQVDHLDFLEQTHINLNDRTLEGFRHKKRPIIAVQYHPEAAPGPHDSRYFFTRFRELIS